MDLDYGFLSLIVTISLPVAAFLLRKRIGAWLGRLLFTNAVKFVQGTYFDEVSVDTADGSKRVLRRPNARLEALVATYGPLSAAWAMEWAKRNIKISLPPLVLPEGSDLKTLGMSALGQKVLSGKKLRLEDGIPLAIGYIKEWAEKSGILDTFAKGIAKKPAADTVTPNPFLKELPK
jgi:hypothetical protein